MANIYIETYGCSLNKSDSEMMAGILKKNNYNITDLEKANLIVINSCTVKAPTKERFFKRLKELKLSNKPIIIAGCIPQTIPEELNGYSLIGPHQINNILEVVEETLNGNVVSLLVEENNKRLLLPKIRKNKVIEIIPIAKGCLGKCTYCVVKKARGKLFSYAQEDILQQAQKAITHGAKEIWITSQDNSAYGFDKNLNLAELLKELVKIKGNFKIRVGMANPNNILKFLDELIEVYKNEKIFKFLHCPVQSGNDDILKLMKRDYSVEDFKQIIRRFRKAIPEITIATDIICGFPTETEQQFNDSVDLIKETMPDIVNISRFGPHKKTAAAKLQQIPGWETKKRSRLLTNIFNNISLLRNERWLDWEGEILIDEIGKNNTFIGRNYCYKQVVVSGNFSLGQIVKVKIKKATRYDLRSSLSF